MKKIDPPTKWNLFCNHRQLVHRRWILCVLLFLGTYHPLQAQENTISVNYSLPDDYYFDPFDVIFSWGSSNSVMINFTGILVHIDIFYQHTSPESLTGLQVAIDTTSLSSSWAEPLQVQSTYIDETQANIPVENGGPFSIHTASIVENPDYGLTPVFSTHIDTDSPKTNGYTAYLGSLDVYVPPDAGGRYNFKFIIDTQYSYWTSESQGEDVKLPLVFESTYFNFDVVTGCCVIDYQDPFDRDPVCYYLTGWWCYEYGGWATPPCLGDCNNTGIDDMCEATPGPRKDCNFNGTLDGCEIEDDPALDCNNNDYIDSCEIEAGAIGDCNENTIPDDCDLANGLDTDCNHNGVPDGCDLSLGIVPDCNNNGLPDDCEGGGTISGDCNANGTLDTCDIDSGTSPDVDGNCVPDECDPKAAPQGEPDPILKSRYLSFTPANAGCSSAIRIKLTSLYHPEPEGTPRPDISAFEGEYRWLGPPSTYLENQSLPAYHFTTAATQCNPYFTNWNTINMLNIMGDVIIPSSSYELQMVDQSCADLNDPNCYSDPLIVSTGKWGDVSEPFVDEFNPSQPNIADILSLVDKWLGTMNPPMVQAQLQPNIPNPSQNVGIADILYDVDAWLGVEYPLDGPTSCNP